MRTTIGQAAESTNQLLCVLLTLSYLGCNVKLVLENTTTNTLLMSQKFKGKRSYETAVVEAYPTVAPPVLLLHFSSGPAPYLGKSWAPTRAMPASPSLSCTGGQAGVVPICDWPQPALWMIGWKTQIREPTNRPV